MSKRSQEDIPAKGQVVIVEVATSKYNGSAGVVTAKSTSDRGSRPYSVRFNDGATKKFRTSDLFLAE